MTLVTLVDRLVSLPLSEAEVISWGCPVLSFGDLANSRVATLGLNPSSREFVDGTGAELEGTFRRFHTLNSLGIESWLDVDARHLHLILDSCRSYFLGNPYDRWFRVLDQVVSGAGASFYDESRAACHLDLVPYATACKWTELTAHQRSLLLDVACDTLGLLLRDSPVRILILNGSSVVEQFQGVTGTCLERREMPAWSLMRAPKPDIVGVSYKGMVCKVAGVTLPQEIKVLGYNHNLQSSFGVTKRVVSAIRDWISLEVSEALA